MTDAKRIVAQFGLVRQRYAARDREMRTMWMARRGDFQLIAPDAFPADMPKLIVADIVDNAARATAEAIAPLPAFNCSSTNAKSDSARAFDDKRTLIAGAYVSHSAVAKNMYTAADWYITYSFLPVHVEPDYEAQMPRMTFEHPIGAYPVFDRWGRLHTFYRLITTTCAQLELDYPEANLKLVDPSIGREANTPIEIILHHDKEATTLILPQAVPGQPGTSLVLDEVANPLGEPMYHIARRPGDSEKGEFAGALWITLAKQRFATLALEAAEKSVQAPLALPNDVQELSLGGDSVLRSNSPEKIRRVPIEIPQGAFSQIAQLDQEARVSARFPEAMTGNVDASIITGRGVQALNGGFDSRINAAHEMLKELLGCAVEQCFALDERLWPNTTKSVRVKESSGQYEVRYTPARDIKGAHTVEVQYGLLAGLDPNRALVFGLQARGDRLISRDWLRRQMPFPLNVTDEGAKVETEELRDALMQSLAAYAQALPNFAAQGQDPSGVIAKIAGVIEGVQKGRPIEAVAKELFPAPPPAPAGPVGGDGQQQEAPPVPGSTDPNAQPQTDAQGNPVQGIGPDGLPAGIAPGQATMGPGGRPDLQVLLAQLGSNGNPNLQATLSRRMPA